MLSITLNTYKTSTSGRDLVKQYEGWSAVQYHGKEDKPGVMTIGWGHVILPHEVFGTITVEQGEELLTHDLVFAEHSVNTYVCTPINQNEFDALVSFTFNLGEGALRMSTLLKLLLVGDKMNAAEEFVKWDHKQQPDGSFVEVPGLKARRLREKALFLTPVGI